MRARRESLCSKCTRVVGFVFMANIGFDLFAAAHQEMIAEGLHPDFPAEVDQQMEAITRTESRPGLVVTEPTYPTNKVQPLDLKRTVPVGRPNLLTYNPTFRLKTRQSQI